MRNLCRVCLCIDRNTFAISNTVLQEMWEKLTSSMYNINDGKPITVCFICCAQLRKAHQLMRRAVKAEEFLTSFISNGFEQTQEALSAMAFETDLDYSYVTKQLYLGECKEFESDIVVEIKKEIESETEEDKAVEIEINIKEEKYDYSDSLREDKPDLDDTKPSALSANDEHIKKEVRIIVEKIDSDQVTKGKVNDVTQNVTPENGKDSPKAKSGICNQNWQISDAATPSTSFARNTKRPRDGKSCPMCPYKCKNTALLRRHIYTHTGEKPFKCDMCDYKCIQKVQLAGHVKHKHTEKNLCHTSDNESVTKSQLDLQPGEGPYKCDLCIYRCPEETELESHRLKMHTKKHGVQQPKKKYLCDFCGYKCAMKSLLVIHRRMHTGEKPYKCDYCDYRSSDKRGVNLHTNRKHTLKKNHTCDICGYKCVRRSSLLVHILLHSEPKPYQCDYCGFKCAIKRGVELHIKRKHTFEKNYSCHICEYRFVTLSGLKKHLPTHIDKHLLALTNEFTFQCDSCDFKASRKDTFNRHLKKHANGGQKSFCCPFCPYQTYYEHSLNEHLCMHTGEKRYACELCDYKSARSGGLKRHMKFKHTKEKEFSCSVCQYKCAEKGYLKKHMVMHTGETPYACKICDFKCSFASSYYHHMRSKHPN